MSRSPRLPGRSAERTHRRRPQAGQAAPLMAAMIALGAIVVLVLIGEGSAAIDGARARTAADAAALAGAADGSDAAEQLARANGAVLVSFVRQGADVVVVVRVRDARAQARARREGTWCPTDTRHGTRRSYTSRSCRSSPG